MPAKDSKYENPVENFYHIFNNGVENTNIFASLEDFQVFVKFLQEYLISPPDPEQLKTTFSVKGKVYKGIPHLPKNFFNKVELNAFSLSPHHFHLVVNEKIPGSLEKLVRSLCTRYAIYFNKKHGRRGSLFLGPYKSIKIKNSIELLYLSRYLHHELLKKNTDGPLAENTFSSYPEYLGLRNTPWVNPSTALSQLKNMENNDASGLSNYKNFVEDHKLSPEEERITDSIIFEHVNRPSQNESKANETPELSVLTPPQRSPEIISEPRSKLPEFIAISLASFVFLFTLGLRNTNISIAQTKNTLASKSQPAPEIAGIKTSEPSEASPSAIPSPTPEILPTKELNLETEYLFEEIESSTESAALSSDTISNKFLEIKITDGSKSVNIRRKAAINSEIVSKAVESDVFEYVSLDAGWYKIILNDKTTAYVSQRYVKEITEGVLR